MPYGTVKVDNVTFTNNSVDATTTFSGIYASITNNLTLSGTATAATFTGTTANFTNVNAQNISVTTSLSGLAITGGTAGFTTITGTTVTGTTANFVTISGTTVTGTTANFVTVSGTTVTGNTGQFTNLAGAAAGFTTVTGTTITGTTANFVSGVFTTRISGTTVTGTTASFTSGVFASLSGTTHTITSGVFALGTAALPSISFVSDPNTGIYSPGADQVAVATNGTEKLIVKSGGEIGIGTSAPAALLHVAGAGLFQVSTTGTAASLATESSSLSVIDGTSYNASPSTSITIGARNYDAVDSNIAFQWKITTPAASASAGARFTISSRSNNATSAGVETPRLTILSGGNVGIGTSSVSSKLHVIGDEIRFSTSSNVSFYGTIAHDGSTTGNNFYNCQDTGGHVFQLNGTEKARIDSSGRLLVGTSTAYTTDTEDLLQIATGSGGNVNLARNDTVVLADNNIGKIRFWGNDEGTYAECATIAGTADGTHTASSRPTRLVFSTTVDGASSPTERLRITSTGRLGLNTAAPAALAHVAGSTIISNVDVANATYDSISFSVAGEETSPAGLFFSLDGRKMFIIGFSGDDINEYTLSTPWNVSTATYVTVFSVSGQDSSPQDLYFRNDGKKLYVVGSTNDSIFQYTLSTPWSVASASYDSISFSVAAEELTPTGLFFKSNGLAFYIVGQGADTVYRYNLTTAWDISTATLANSFSVAAQEATPNAMSFTADGSRMFVMGSAGDDVNIYNLTTPWDITTAAFVTVFSVAAQESTPGGLFVKPDGTKFYIVGTTSDIVFQYSIPSATIDLTGTTNINGSAEVAQDLTVYGDISSGSIQVTDAGDIAVGTTTGTKIGTATTQKLGFYNATPVVQPTAVADATTAVDVITQLNALLAKLRTLGIIAT